MVVGLYLFLAQHYKSLNDINFQVSLWVTTNQQVRTNFSVPHPSQLLYQHCHVHKLQSFIVSLSTLHLGEWQEGGFKRLCFGIFFFSIFSRLHLLVLAPLSLLPAPASGRQQTRRDNGEREMVHPRHRHHNQLTTQGYHQLVLVSVAYLTHFHHPLDYLINFCHSYYPVESR